MNAARQDNPLLTAVLSRLIRPLQGKAWWLAASLVFISVLGVTTYTLWQRYGQRVTSQQRYRLNIERLQVTPQPDWIRTNIKENAIAHGQLHNANLLDATLTLQVKQAFGVQPWVRRVKRVNKQYPSTVEVDLEFRRPIAMVETPPGMFPPHNYAGIVPIDEEGYLLPTEIIDEKTQQAAQRYPKIAGVDASPAGPPGNPWGDTRVADAARIISLLEKLWKPLDLYQIEVPPRTSGLDADIPQDFILVTRKGRRHNWQSAPGKERRNEPTAREKLEFLRKVVEQYGALDNWQQTDEAKITDLMPRRRR